MIKICSFKYLEMKLGGTLVDSKRRYLEVAEVKLYVAIANSQVTGSS